MEGCKENKKIRAWLTRLWAGVVIFEFWGSKTASFSLRVFHRFFRNRPSIGKWLLFGRLITPFLFIKNLSECEPLQYLSLEITLPLRESWYWQKLTWPHAGFLSCMAHMWRVHNHSGILGFENFWEQVPVLASPLLGLFISCRPITHLWPLDLTSWSQTPGYCASQSAMDLLRFTVFPVKPFSLDLKQRMKQSPPSTFIMWTHCTALSK